MFQDVDVLFLDAAAERTVVARHADRVGSHLGEAAARSRAGGPVAALRARVPMVVAGVRSATSRAVGLGVPFRPSVVR